MKPLPYADPVGNKATARADRHLRATRHGLNEDTARHVMERTIDRDASNAELAYLYRIIGPALAKDAA